MVVKSQSDSAVKGEVCSDVIFMQVHLTILNILGMHEENIIDQVFFLQDHGADKTVKIAPRHQPVFFLDKASPLSSLRTFLSK